MAETDFQEPQSESSLLEQSDKVAMEIEKSDEKENVNSNFDQNVSDESDTANEDGVDIEEEQRRVEEKCRKLEEEKIRAEAECTKREEEEQLAEEECSRLEEERVRVEEEYRRREEERMRAKDEMRRLDEERMRAARARERREEEKKRAAEEYKRLEEKRIQAERDVKRAKERIINDQLEAICNIDEEKVNILLVGAAAAGKSSLINTLINITQPSDSTMKIKKYVPTAPKRLMGGHTMVREPVDLTKTITAVDNRGWHDWGNQAAVDELIAQIRK